MFSFWKFDQRQPAMFFLKEAERNQNGRHHCWIFLLIMNFSPCTIVQYMMSWLFHSSVYILIYHHILENLRRNTKTKRRIRSWISLPVTSVTTRKCLYDKWACWLYYDSLSLSLSDSACVCVFVSLSVDVFLSRSVYVLICIWSIYLMFVCLWL